MLKQCTNQSCKAIWSDSLNTNTCPSCGGLNAILLSHFRVVANKVEDITEATIPIPTSNYDGLLEELEVLRKSANLNRNAFAEDTLIEAIRVIGAS